MTAGGRRREAAAAGLIVLEDAALDPVVTAVLDRSLDAMAVALARWGRFARPVTVRSTPDEAQLRQAGPCPSELRLRGVAGLDGLLLLATPSWPEQPSTRDLQGLLTHELAHVLLYQRCTPPGATLPPYVPTWFREGMATVAADGPPPPSLRRELAQHPHLAELPGASDAVMARHGDACYEAAALLFQAWVDRFGPRALPALCRELRTGHGFAAAHRRACGIDEAAFVAGWIAEVRAEARTD